MDGNFKDLLTSGRRDRMEIMAAIVVLTQKTSKITPLIDQTHLSYTMVKDYLKSMRKLGLIENRKVESETDKRYQVFQATQKGLAFLKIYCDILRLLYGEGFIKNQHNLAVVCLKYCKEVDT